MGETCFRPHTALFLRLNLFTLQTYWLSTDHANFLAGFPNLRQRNALRLFFYLKTHGHASSFYIKKLRPELLKFFHEKQIKKYFEILISEGWVGRDIHGKYFLRGRTRIILLFGQKSKTRGVDMPFYVTERHSDWVSFLAGVQVTECQRRLKRYAWHERIGVASTSQRGGIADVKESPVSLDNLTSMLAVSRATASRIRTRAAKGGFITNRVSLVDVTDEYGLTCRNDLLRLRGSMAEHMAPYRTRRAQFFDSLLAPVIKAENILEDATKCLPVRKLLPNPDALIWKDGRAWLQYPNMVSTCLSVRSYRN